MLSRLFIFLCRFAPLKRTLWRKWYDYLAGRYRESDWTFMNYGYAGRGLDPPDLSIEDEPNRSCIQLYHFVASSADLGGKRILEVGSGRGGGIAYVMRRMAPASATGLDFAPKAVAFCRKRHGVPGLAFEIGSAEALPFENDSFDAVLNVESSHCYGSMDGFLAEVRRVLKRGGSFLYADLREAASLEVWKDQLTRSGMKIVKEVDITANVLAALDADSDRKQTRIRKLIPKPLLASFEDFAGIRGSNIYVGFQTGRLVYRCYQLQKL
jgi:ubiquinone/menaquinone biosynthesis C-methylase UbiE